MCHGAHEEMENVTASGELSEAPIEDAIDARFRRSLSCFSLLLFAFIYLWLLSSFPGDHITFETSKIQNLYHRGSPTKEE
jgi:hypothetical protein